MHQTVRYSSREAGFELNGRLSLVSWPQLKRGELIRAQGSKASYPNQRTEAEGRSDEFVETGLEGTSYLLELSYFMEDSLQQTNQSDHYRSRTLYP